MHCSISLTTEARVKYLIKTRWWEKLKRDNALAFDYVAR